MYERLTPIDAIYTYGMGFNPIPFTIESTIGIATAAVAVVDVTSESNKVKVIITVSVKIPPDNPPTLVYRFIFNYTF